MTTREQLEAEAEESYRYPNCEGYTVLMSTALVWLKQGWVQAKTVSAEQVETAAEGIYRDERDRFGGWQPFESLRSDIQDIFRGYARAAFRAAGFYVEAADD